MTADEDALIELREAEEDEEERLAKRDRETEKGPSPAVLFGESGGEA